MHPSTALSRVSKDQVHDFSLCIVGWRISLEPARLYLKHDLVTTMDANIQRALNDKLYDKRKVGALEYVTSGSIQKFSRLLLRFSVPIFGLMDI